MGVAGVPARTLAATALALAAEMDDPMNTAAAAASCARALVEVMDRVKALAPVEEGDRLDDLASRRERRLAGGSNPKG